MKLSIGILLLTNAIVCNAAIYQQTDQNGNTIYSDESLGEHPQKLDISSSAQNITKLNNQDSNNKPVEESVLKTNLTHQEYTTFEILTPKNQETFQNQISIPVEIKLEPALQTGDTLQFFVDGKPWGAATTNTKLELSLLDRGIHEISVAIQDKDNVILKKSNNVTIFVHRASVNSIKANSQ